MTRTRRTFFDYWLVGRVAFLQVAVACSLRVVSWARFRRAMPWLRAAAQFGGAPREARLVWALEASGRRLRGISTCLVRALVAELLIDSPDDPVRVTIGVRRSGPAFESHAWVERGDDVIIGEKPANEISSVKVSYVPILTWEVSSRANTGSR